MTVRRKWKFFAFHFVIQLYWRLPITKFRRTFNYIYFLRLFFIILLSMRKQKLLTWSFEYTSIDVKTWKYSFKIWCVGDQRKTQHITKHKSWKYLIYWQIEDNNPCFVWSFNCVTTHIDHILALHTAGPSWSSICANTRGQGQVLHRSHIGASRLLAHLHFQCATAPPLLTPLTCWG